MARQSRKKQPGVIGTLLVELSALAGIFGIAQPTVRSNIWQMLQPRTVNSQLNQPPVNGVSPVTGYPQQLDQYVSQPDSFVPSYIPETYQSSYPPAYTAQAVIPRDLGNRPSWKPSGYNPMGTYQ